MSLTERIAAAKPKPEPPREPLWVRLAREKRLPAKVYR